MYKRIIFYTAILCLLILPILYFAIPVITYGISDLSMIKYFDVDEGNLVEFAAKTYSHGIIPIEDGVAYPQFYYYFCGILLYPYTLMKGIDFTFIALVLRSVNVLAAIATSIGIYLFTKKFFKSSVAGVVGSLCFLYSPYYYYWIINSRPHVLEIFIIVGVLYFCFKLLDRYRFGYVAAAVVLSGAAMATKYGGLFLIPVVWVAVMINISKFNNPKLLKLIRPHLSTIYAYCVAMLIGSVLVPFAALFAYHRYPHKFLVFKITNFQEFVASKDFRLLLLISGIVCAGALIWLIANNLTSRAVAAHHKTVHKRILLLNLAFLYLFYIGGCIIAGFFVFNPSYILYPVVTLKRFALQTAISTMTTGLNPGLKTPLFDPAGFIWIRMLFLDLFNGWFTSILAVCSVFWLMTFKNDFARNKIQSYRKWLLFMYSLVLFLVLYICFAHRTHHYLFPAQMCLAILMGVGMVEIVRYARTRPMKVFWCCVFGILLIGGFFQRYADIRVLHASYAGRDDRRHVVDTGIIIGKWLADTYPRDAVIWNDCRDFYIPSTFSTVVHMMDEEDIDNKYAQINELQPRVLVITSKNDALLTNNIKIVRALETRAIKDQYTQVKVFDYHGPLVLTSNGGRYKRVYIYERNNT